MTKHQRLAVLFTPLALGALVACTDPVGDAPKATVAPSDTPASASAPAPSGSGAPTASAVPAGATRYAFVQDGTQEGAMITFVGAKVTQKHDGGFKKINGTIDVSGDQAKVDAEIDMASVYTDTPKLTGHLQSPDLFDVAKFPTARFTSKSITKNADGTSTVTGDLTLHGVTKTLSFPATVAATPEEASAKAEFAINRKDFGIVYPGMPDDLIKDEVLLKLDVKAKSAR